jgi:outer membrane protein assembly factor BamB
MEPRHLALLAIGLSVLLGVGLAVGLAPDPDDDLTTLWTAGEGTEISDNHHRMAALSVEGDPVVAVPINDGVGAETCGVYALDADGEERWSAPLDPENCSVHSVGDVGTSDDSFLVVTADHGAAAFDADDGAVRFSEDLATIGYPAPVVADVTGDGSEEFVAVDHEGGVSVFGTEGETLWEDDLEGFVWATPLVVGDEQPTLLVAHGSHSNGTATAYDADGEVAWEADLGAPSMSWAPVEGSEGDVAVVAATRDGGLVGLSAEGEIEWESDLPARGWVSESAGEAVTLTTEDGAVHTVSVADGEARWSAEVDAERPVAPAQGDVTGDGSDEVVVLGREGSIAVLDEGGAVVAEHDLDAAVHTPATLVDVEGDGREDVVVLHGDGTVTALSYDG